MKIFVLSVSLFLASCFAQDATASKSEEAKKTVLLVTRSGSRSQWTATAFFVSTTRLLTAAHTFKKSNDQWVVKDGREVHCRIVRIDYKKDIALIECEEANETFFRLVSTIKLVGFPFGHPVEEPSGKIDRQIHAGVYFVDGMSGCPMVNEYGDVEAMGVQGDSGNDHDCRAIPASILSDFIKD